MTWVQALRAFLSSPHHLRSQNATSTFERVARAHLKGPPGHVIHARSLPLLRQLRWEILQSGTPEQKALTLEAIVAIYADASHSYTYDPAVSAKENHAVTLELLQCILEAQVMGLPVCAAHYRFLLQSPQLSEISPDLPRAVLGELVRSGETALDDARVDASVGLASAGHWEAALSLVSSPSLFPVIVERVASAQRGSWRFACHLAAQISDEAAVRDKDFLCTIVAALALRRACAGPDQIVWNRVVHLIDAYGKTQSGRPSRRLLESALACCPPDQWRVAMEMVKRHSDDGTPRVSLEAAMALLNAARRWEQSLSLYDCTPLRARDAVNATHYNHALAALLSVKNRWQEALALYNSAPVTNDETHRLWLTLALLEQRVPFAAAWEGCLRAFFSGTEAADARCAECLALRCAGIGAWALALAVVEAASCKYPRTLLTMMVIAAVASKKEVLWRAAAELSKPHRNLPPRWLTAAAAIIACCDGGGAPDETVHSIADAIRGRATSQQQLDDNAFQLGRCIAVILRAPGGDNGTAMVSFFAPTDGDVLPQMFQMLLDKRNRENAIGVPSKSWISALAVVQRMCKRQPLNAIAPGMLSSGLDPAVAIHFLPS